MIKLSQTTDILNSVLKENEIKLNDVNSFNAQFIKLQKKWKVKKWFLKIFIRVKNSQWISASFMDN